MHFLYHHICLICIVYYILSLFRVYRFKDFVLTVDIKTL